MFGVVWLSLSFREWARGRFFGCRLKTSPKTNRKVCPGTESVFQVTRAEDSYKDGVYPRAEVQPRLIPTHNFSLYAHYKRSHALSSVKIDLQPVAKRESCFRKNRIGFFCLCRDMQAKIYATDQTGLCISPHLPNTSGVGAGGIDHDTLLARKHGAELSADISIASHSDGQGHRRGKQRLPTSLISAPIPHSKSLFTCHSINTKMLSCFFENRSIVLQCAVNCNFGQKTTEPAVE